MSQHCELESHDSVWVICQQHKRCIHPQQCLSKRLVNATTLVQLAWYCTGLKRIAGGSPTWKQKEELEAEPEVCTMRQGEPVMRRAVHAQKGNPGTDS
jgi:hypothetical protein